MKLVKETDSTLRMRANSVHTDMIEGQVLRHIKEMKKIMKKNNGVGLAAPQVGIGLRFFISKIDGHRLVINPKVNHFFGPRTSQTEGCLSFPGRTRRVSRYHGIETEWTDRHNKQKRTTLVGFEARIFQHETDHLNGICIFD